MIKRIAAGVLGLPKLLDYRMLRLLRLVFPLFVVVLVVHVGLSPASAAEVAASSAVSPVERMTEILDQPASLEFDHVPLADFAAELAKRWQINVVVDHKALEEAGIAPETPISGKVESLPLKSALSLLLRPVELDWVVRDEVLTFSTRDVVENHYETRVYDVNDLVESAGDVERTEFYDMLLELIVSTVEPDTWIDNEAAGDIRSFDAGGIQTLVVYQQRHVHDQIEALLKRLVKARHDSTKPKSSARET